MEGTMVFLLLVPPFCFHLLCVLLKFPSQAKFPSLDLAPKWNSLETFRCVHLAILEGEKLEGGGICFLLLFGA